jgi:hypothetical protein
MSTIVLLALALWLLPAALLALIMLWFFALPQTEWPVRRVFALASPQAAVSAIMQHAIIAPCHPRAASRRLASSRPTTKNPIIDSGVAVFEALAQRWHGL